MLTCIQFGLNTTDMAATLRLYSESFGFRNAGGQGIWGETIKIQGLAPDSRAVMWWLLGTQPFFQFEIFQHSKPEPRLRPDDWRPCDHGWVRFGIGVPNYDAALAGLDEFGIALLGQAGTAGARKSAFYDPFIGAVVELRETPGADGPMVIYGAASVADLEGARDFYGNVVGLELGALEELHQPEDEALWGLAGAQREGFTAKAGDVSLEIVRYDDPAGRPRRADHRASDQSFFNVAFGSREIGEVADALARLRAAGIEQMNVLEKEGILSAYVNQAERESEFSLILPELDAILGFEPQADFFG